jgi:hypothetical protein
VSRVRENRMHGSTGGGWKRSTLATDTEKNDIEGNPESPAAPRPKARNCHRASPRPYVILVLVIVPRLGGR